MNWYYVRGGQRNGPVDEEAIRRLIAVGELKPNDLVWNEGMGDKWVEAFLVPGLLASSDRLGAPGATRAYDATSVSDTTAPAAAGPSGQTPNRELMARARASLAGQWGNAVVACIIYMAVSFALNMIPFAGVLGLLIAGPLYVGFCIFFLSVIRTRGEVGQIFSGFQQFGRALGAYLLMVLFILLWMLLLIIPGIIMSYAYMMTFFVLADDPQVGARDALRRSVDMMRGHKWKLFCLYFRFIGWSLLAMLTCGIGFLWLMPYMQTALAHFYEDVKPRAG